MHLTSFVKNKTILVLAICVFFFAFLLRMWNLGQAGQVWDENSLLREYAYHHIHDALNLDFGNEFWWKGTPDHPPLVRYMRGIVSQLDIVGWDKNHWPIYSYALFYDRLLSVILTSLGAVIVFIIGSRYFSRFTGVTAAMIYSMLPIPLGHSQLAMLEPLALFFFPASMLTFFLFLEKPTRNRIILAGMALGFALLARETHLMLLPMMLIMIFFKWKTQHLKTNVVKSLYLKTCVIFAVSFFTFFCFWPMPFFHLDYMYKYFIELRATTTTSIPEVFFGRLMFVPVPYYIVHFIITTPLLILLLLFVGLKKIDRSRNWIWYSLVLWLCFPFLLSFYPNRQQGIRYIIQIVIPLSIIAAYGFETIVNFLVKDITKKFLILFFLFLYQFIILWRITPYYIDYFNILVGGAKGVYDKKLFHLAWWGEGLKEATEYINSTAPKGARIGIATTPSHTYPPMPGKIILPYKDSDSYDYVIVNYYNVYRIGFNDSLVKQKYRLVYSVKADGAHLVDIYKRP